MQLHACPYPGTCRYYGEKKGAPRCRRGTCPFRIHLRRMVAGEMQRLAGKGDLTPAQRRELEVLKKEYARLLGGEAHGTEAPQTAPQPRALEAAVLQYLESCEGQRLPTLPGLALALGFSSRGELERFAAAQGGRVSRLLEWAASWVEEETLQAACRKETASGARFILQTAFGYGERAAPDLGPITVQVEDGEGGEA